MDKPTGMSREYVLQPFRPPVNLRIDYAGELNAQQHAAVTAPPGPALVLAGAGAGKTRTLIYRVAYLLEQGIPAERMQRIAREVGLSAYHVCRLFHRVTGTKLHQYRVRLRLRAALTEVVESARPLTDIALDAGFSSHSH